MATAEFIIIYLACGAPFGVQYLLDSTDRPILHTIAGVAARFLAWPIGAALMLVNLFTAVPQFDRGGDNPDGDALARVRSKFESQIMLSDRSTSIFEFRDVFLRYTGLAESIGDRESSPGVSELFRVAGHHDERLAGSCLQRKVVSKLEYHRERSRSEFSLMIESILSETDDRNEIVSLAVETAECVSDRRYAAELRRRYGLEPLLARNESSNDKLGDIWNTGSQHHSIAN